MSVVYCFFLYAKCISNPLAVESGITKKVKGLRLVCNEDFSQAESRGVEEEEGEGENTLDSSLEEPELVETSPKGAGEAAELQEGTSKCRVFEVKIEGS